MNVWRWPFRQAWNRVDMDTVSGQLSDDELLELCEQRDIPRYQTPIDAIDSLPDEPGRVYAWIVEGEAERLAMLDRLEAYQERYRELDAIHTVLTDKNELYELTAEQLKPYLDL